MSRALFLYLMLTSQWSCCRRHGGRRTCCGSCEPSWTAWSGQPCSTPRCRTDPHFLRNRNQKRSSRWCRPRCRPCSESSEYPGPCHLSLQSAFLTLHWKQHLEITVLVVCYGNLLEQFANSIWKSAKDHIIIRDNACNSIRVATHKTQGADRHGLKISPQFSELLRV